jgi:ribose-phosphate pyrophosphokinase
MLYLNDVPVVPTVFPDGTSQVWKVDAPKDGLVVVRWEFEHEGEVMHLLQLAMLLKSMDCDASLDVPFLPYGRQDKSVGNESTFALHALGKILSECGFFEVRTTDAHSKVLAEYVHLVDDFPEIPIRLAIERVAANVLCFPDHGAHMRYRSLKTRCTHLVLEKLREQQTGTITGIRMAGGCVVDGDIVLIVDDICDGGRTFIEAAKLIKENAPGAQVHLYVSHGIFSKGLLPLWDAGIGRIFTKDGEVYEPILSN